MDNGTPPLEDSVSFQVTAANCEFDRAAWIADESGGTPGDQGTVAGACQPIITEGDSFLVTLSQTFTVPGDRSLVRFAFDSLVFDLNDAVGMNDAFEAALLDATGRPLVHTFTPARDAFFNITEGRRSIRSRYSAQ